MSAPLLNGAYPQQGIGTRIHRYLVVETANGVGFDERDTDELVLVDWIATEVIDRADVRQPGGTYWVNAYVPTNQHRIPEKYRRYLMRGSWPEESLHLKPSQAWAQAMRHWEHELGAAKLGIQSVRDTVQMVRGKSPETRQRELDVLHFREARITERQRRADYCRAQWIAAVHAEAADDV